MSTWTTRISTASRSRGQSLLSRGGARLAKLDQRWLPHRLIVWAMPLAITKRFDPRVATDLEAIFELRVRDQHGGEPACFALLVCNGRCEARSGQAANPQATATLGADDMIRLASGGVGWPELLSTGRLELRGDPFLGLRLPNLFGFSAEASNR
jgi:SCP-2 sterol transfer family